jgi:plasmid maintenance system antidote protein VapI
MKTISIFDYESYKEYFAKRIESMPRKGHGQLSRLASQLGVPPVTVSQIFKGDRELTLDQALEVSGFLGLSTAEQEYLFLLVQKARAVTAKLTTHIS